MPPTEPISVPPAALFSRRNLLLIAVALASIGAGYAVLLGGSPGAAAVLLVAGYCVLFPLALLA